MSIQRHNFATAFSLAHGPTLGESLRVGQGRHAAIPFRRFSWRGKSWVTGLDLELPDLDFFKAWPFEILFSDIWSQLPPVRLFAIEETRAKIALIHFLTGDSEESTDIPELTPIEAELRRLGRRGDDDIGQGAVFPDGLALIESSRLQFEFVVWDVRHSEFVRPVP